MPSTNAAFLPHKADNAVGDFVVLNGLPTCERVDYIYPILDAKRVQRGTLTEDQTGTPVVSNSDEWFWFFTLGPALKLKKTLIQPRKEHFELKLVKRDDLTRGYGWDDLPELYSSLVKKVH